MIAARKGGRQVTWNLLWLRMVAPRDGDLGSGLVDESGEELEGGYVSQPSSPDECQPGSDEGLSRDLERSCSTDRGRA
ncbi:hypothetical protein NDU88_006284 [Pleurodeles waltl]|uniref:Uncharacterized protein n=1 Tax=Pleurodeles waltl TaxID=8319 RepID=A0AAV7ULZ9_PLEWA|nr:hypothetical protein NDU88_006284 [Pleurodeles waltl]